jgi:uncharacterized protein (DUF362 family)
VERREFCRFLGVCGLIACSGGLTGCARALQWSEAQHAGIAVREFGASGTASADASASASATGSTVASGTAGGSPLATFPDLAVTTGNDPAANTVLAVEMLGGMGRFVKRGSRVVIKPNILTAREPQFGVTTNPEAVAAAVKMCWEAGAKSVTVFDRPTAPPLQAYTVSGIQDAVRRVDGNMKVLSDRDFERIAIPKGRVLTSWPLLVDVFDADVMINMPCAKTHGLAGLTLSMKNLMGVMGGLRGTVHQDFTQKIIDVNTLIRPQLTILDAYRLLFRNGPTGGGMQDVKMGRTCIAGTNQISIDAYGATLFGMKAADLDYVARAAEQGLGIADLSKLTIEKRSA